MVGKNESNHQRKGGRLERKGDQKQNLGLQLRLDKASVTKKRLRRNGQVRKKRIRRLTTPQKQGKVKLSTSNLKWVQTEKSH